RLLRAQPAGGRLSRGRPLRVGERAARGPGERRRALVLPSQRLLAPDGHAARQAPARGDVGQRTGAMEGVGVDPSFWSGRRVLLTGHTGFKGAWLALWLERLGAEVTGFADGIPTNPSLYDTARVSEGLRSVEGDVRDLDAVEAVFADSRPEVVIHM